jgi:two-component system, NarL family, nitrate/nitrite response regulator NarL
MRPRVLIADHAPTRLGARMSLHGEADVCAEAGDAGMAIAAAYREQPDVSLVGLEIPGGGLTAVRGICDVAPATAVIVLAGNGDVDDLLAAVRAGAVGYVPGCGVNAAQLRRIVRAVASHEAAVPRSMVLHLLAELRAAEGPADERLTRREAQVLGMLRRGHSTAVIARRLAISPVTVRRHVSELIRKRGVEDRAALVGQAGLEHLQRSSIPARAEPHT